MAAWNGIYAIEEYRRSQGKKHWRANYTRRAINNRNGDIVATVDVTVCRAQPTDGFQEMIDAGLDEFLWERLVLRFPEHFSTSNRRTSQRWWKWGPTIPVSSPLCCVWLNRGSVC